MPDTEPPRKPVRVLITDDSELSRLVLEQLLSADPDIEVVGTAASGEEAVELTVQLRPDIVTMDLYLPGIDGIASTQRLMQRRPTPVIIVTSSEFWQRKDDVFAAFKYGVLDVIEKPNSATDERAARILVDKVKLLSRVKVTSDVWPTMSQRPRARSAAQPPAADHRAILIGASTGGPRAIQQVLQALPGDLSVPVLVAQHMSPSFVPGFADWLDQTVDLAVRMARAGDVPTPGLVLLSPGGTSMVLDKRGVVQLSDEPPPQNVLPSVDLLFSSAARHYGAGAIGVVLTGIGKDGRQGMTDIKGAGGVTLVQDEGSSVVFGMPGAALRAGVVDEVAHIDVIGTRLMELVRNSAASKAPS